MIVDAHHHLWRYRPEEFGWIDSEALKRDFTVEDLRRDSAATAVGGSIVCEARQSVEETEMLLETAGKGSFILGAVGWLPIADWFGLAVKLAIPLSPGERASIFGETAMKAYAR